MTRVRRQGCLAAIALVSVMPLSAQQRPAAVATHLPEDVMAMACAPTLAFETPSPSLLLTGGQDSFLRRSFGPGDLVTINAGVKNGIEVGQEFFVRRLQPSRAAVSRSNPATVRTAGWIRVYAVDAAMSLATITHACDTIDVGDYLEPFAVPRVAVADTFASKAQRENYGHILLGVDRRTSFAKNDFFVIDRGSDHGVTLGQRVVVYRDKQRAERTNRSAENPLPATVVPEFLYDLGEAVVVDVKPDISTLKATVARDAFLSGDFVALRVRSEPR